MRTGWITVIGVGLLSLGAIGIENAIHATQAGRVLSIAANSPERAARVLAAQWAPPATECSRVDVRDEPKVLMRAIIALERLKASPIERRFEWLVLHSYIWTGVVLRDVSVGPGQIRLSTFSEMQETSQSSSADGDIGELLTVCGTIKAGRVILNRRIPERADCRMLLSRQDVLWAASKWNTSGAHLKGEAAFSHRVYQELVYHTFQVLRFDLPRDLGC